MFPTSVIAFLALSGVSCRVLTHWIYYKCQLIQACFPRNLGHVTHLPKDYDSHPHVAPGFTITLFHTHRHILFVQYSPTRIIIQNHLFKREYFPCYAVGKAYFRFHITFISNQKQLILRCKHCTHSFTNLVATLHITGCLSRQLFPISQFISITQ